MPSRARPALSRPAGLRVLLPTRLVPALRLLWVLAIIWYELLAFYWSTVGCRWPDRALLQTSDSGAPVTPTHVLLVADPQVIDSRSYPGRPWPLSTLGQLVVDLNLRKNWNAARRFRPDVVVFLGDMMDGGRFNMNDVEYEEYYERFKSIFRVDPGTEVYYIPGNHDVGLGKSRSFSPAARRRYVEHFGELNYKISLANHTLVMLDAPGLVEEDYRRAPSNMNFEQWPAPPGGAIDFISKFASGSDEPVVLFTHIPLFRPDTAPCGPLRERGTIRRGVGFGYQNTLGRHTTNYILNHIRPNLVFSGDDHDYCEYTHSVPLLADAPDSRDPQIARVREVTVKSLSMAMGVHYPGFQLLSLAPDPARRTGDGDGVGGGVDVDVDVDEDVPRPRHADAPCILPDQIAIYVGRYAPLLVLTLIALAVRAVRVGRRLGLGLGLGLNLFGLGFRTGFWTNHTSSSSSSSLTSEHKHRASGLALAPSLTRIKLSPRVHSAHRSSFSVDADPIRSGAGPGSGAGSGSGSAADAYFAARSASARTAPPGTPEVRLDLGVPAPSSPAASASASLGAQALEERASRWRGPGSGSEYDNAYAYEYENNGGDGDENYIYADDDVDALPGGGGGPARRRSGWNWSWSWSWAFTLGGRRRRITLGVPSFSFLSSSTSPSSISRRRTTPPPPHQMTQTRTRTRSLGLLGTFLSDVRATAWPPVLVFVLVNVYVAR